MRCISILDHSCRTRRVERVHQELAQGQVWAVPCPGRRRKRRPVISSSCYYERNTWKKSSLWEEIGSGFDPRPAHFWCEDAVVFCQSTRFRSHSTAVKLSSFLSVKGLQSVEAIQRSRGNKIQSAVTHAHTHGVVAPFSCLPPFYMLPSQVPCRDIWTKQIHVLNKGKLNHQAAHFTLKTDFNLFQSTNWWNISDLVTGTKFTDFKQRWM